MTTLAQISETQAQKATTANENFAAVSVAGIYGRRPAGTSGLTWGYYGGIFPGNYSAIADGTLSLTGNATNYIEADTATGALSVNTSGWTASGKKRVYSVTTNASAVTAYTDYRTVLDIAAAALAGANTWTGVNTFDEDVIIGSGSPSATLTCNGPVTINSSLTINGWIAGPVSFTGQVTFDEDVVIGSGSPTATLTCNGTVTINAGTLNNVVIGGLGPAAGTFTALTASGALTYGGVTLSAAVTGTGSMVLSTSPTLVTPAFVIANYGIRSQLTGTDRVSVTGATTIFSLGTTGSSIGASGALCVVNGYDTGNTANSFVDAVLFMGGVNPTVLGATNRGSPTARTYTASGGSSLQLAMASGTYNVSVNVTEQAN